MADQFASSVVSTRHHLVALVRAKLTTRGTRAEGGNGTDNFRNFQISSKKDNLERLTGIFETNFGKISVFHPISNRNFPKFCRVEWNAPFAFSLAFYVLFSSMDTRHQFCRLFHTCTSFRSNCTVHIVQSIKESNKYFIHHCSWSLPFDLKNEQDLP